MTQVQWKKASANFRGRLVAAGIRQEDKGIENVGDQDVYYVNESQAHRFVDKQLASLFKHMAQRNIKDIDRVNDVKCDAVYYSIRSSLDEQNKSAEAVRWETEVNGTLYVAATEAMMRENGYTLKNGVAIPPKASGAQPIDPHA